MNHRTAGRLLLLASPVVAAGAITALAYAEASGRMRVWDGTAFTLWGAATAASAVGGFLIPAAGASKPRRALAGLAGAAFGAGAYFAVLNTGDIFFR